MLLTRRDFTRNTVALGLAAGGLSRPAIAANEPIRFGWLAALTGPASSAALGYDRGVRYRIDQINAGGGVNGRKIELVTRDTQGDPTKAVNAVQEMISSQRVHAIWGPTNSGEALAVTPIMARFKIPNMSPCVLDSLIDPVKWPFAFRLAASNTQWDTANRLYCTNVLKAKSVAVLGDNTGYGTTATAASVDAFQKAGVKIAYQTLLDTAALNPTPDLLRARDAGAEAVTVWSGSTGLVARLMNARTSIGWDVAFTGNPAMGSGDVLRLLDKPSNWDKVYIIGYRNCSFDAAGKLAERTQAFVDRTKGKIALADTLLSWVCGGVDAVDLVAEAVARSGSSDAAAIAGYWNNLRNSPGLFGDYTFGSTQHNGFPTEEVVMSSANTQRDGAFSMAPGYA